MEPIEIFESERVKGLRVVLSSDDDPMGMDEDWSMPYTVRLWTGHSGDCTAEAGAHFAGSLDPEDVAILRAEHRDDELVASGLRESFGAIDVECLQPGREGDRWYLIATRKFAAEAMGLTGEPDQYTDEQRALIRTALVQAAQTVTDHVERNIYRWEFQRERKGQVVYDNAEVEEVTDWETEESCGSVVGWEWAQEDARAQLADAELAEPIAFPQQRPHFSRPRGDTLWKSVIVPALMGETRADYFTVRTVLPPGEREWGIDLRIGWGIDTTTEQHLDEARTWVALVACATGALPLDSAVALECRDLVLADRQSTPAPLSQPTAETVVQVALLGSAPYPDVH